MNTKKGKGKSKRDKTKSKAIIGVVLAAIMLASVFAGISASVGSPGNPRVTATEGSNTPTEHITNSSDTNVSIFQVQFKTWDEDIYINDITVMPIGTINATNLTKIRVFSDEDHTGTYNPGVDEYAGTNTSEIQTGVNNKIVLTSPVLVATVKDIIITVDTEDFTLGECIQFNLTSYNATSKMTGEATTPHEETLPLTSSEICGAGNLTISEGAEDVEDGNYTDAGTREGIVIQQINFTATLQNVDLTDITLEWNGTADSANDIGAVYLVNDTDADGAWDATEVNVTAIGTFVNNETTLVFTREKTVTKDENTTYLVVVNTSSTFWAGETLAVNITDFNAVEKVNKVFEPSPGPLASSTTIGQAVISVTEGKKPTLNLIPNGDNTNVEIMQVNFTATAGKVNITNIVLNLNTTYTTTSGVHNETYPSIYWDKDNDGKISPGDVCLNKTPRNFNLSVDNGLVSMSLSQNMTIGSSEYLLIAINTTDIGDNKAISVEINNTWKNYTAYCSVTEQSITNKGTPVITPKKLTALSAAPEIWAEKGDNQPNSIEALAHDLQPVFQINFSSFGASPMVGNTAIDSITVRENGTANATGDISAVGLVIDSDGDGKVDPGETLIATALFTEDNGFVTFIPSPDIEFREEVKSVLITVNTTSNYTVAGGRTMRFYMLNRSTDYNASAGGTSSLTDDNETGIVSDELSAKGSVEALLGASTPLAGSVSADVDTKYLPLMQLNFTAGAPENVTINNITLTWNGTAASSDSVDSIGVVNDTNGNGVIDWEEGEIVLATNTWTNNRTLLNLGTQLNVTKGSTVSVLIYVNTSTPITAGKTLAINLSNPSTDYNATGTDSEQPITDPSTDAISSNAMITGSTGELLVKGEAWTPTKGIIKGNRADVAILKLNFSATGEAVNVTSIKITAASAINEVGNVTGVALRVDGDIVTADRQNFTANNGTVTLEPSAITVPKGNWKEVEVIANISADLTAGDNITLKVNNPAIDIEGVGCSSVKPIHNESETAISDHVIVTGNVSAKIGDNTTVTGPVTAMAQNETVIMQVNFTAEYESVNVAGINVTWLGDVNASGNITVGAYNDSDGSGTITGGDTWLGGDDEFGSMANISFTTPLTIVNDSSANMLLYLNVTGPSGYNFTIGKDLQIELTGYTAKGVTSSQEADDLTLTSYGVAMESNTLTGTGNITVVSTGSPANAYIVAGANTTVPVWKLNMSTNGENATLDSVTLTFNGTATGISAVDLYYDKNSNGTVEAANDTLIASGMISESKVTLTPTTDFYVNTTVKSLLVTVNTTADFKDNETIAFNITCTKRVNATGVESGIVIARNFIAPLSSNILTGKCSIDVYKPTTQPTEAYNGTHNNVKVLKLNFHASRCNVDILNITLQENGTAKVNTGAEDCGVTNISVWYDSVCYNSTAQFTTENGSLVIDTTGLTLDCSTTNKVMIKVNTTANLTTGQTLFFEMNRTLGVGYNATCNASRETPYSNETGVINNTITVTPTLPEVEGISLEAGWNLISLWKIPTDKSIEVVTADILDTLNSSCGVWAYDAQTGWLSYAPGAPADLTEMSTGWGYWIKMNATDTLPISDTWKFLPDPPETPPTYTVYEGWNLIGFHSLNESRVNATDYLEGVDWKPPMYKFNAATGQYEWTRGTDAMEQGKGYWLAVTVPEATIYPY